MKQNRPGHISPSVVISRQCSSELHPITKDSEILIFQLYQYLIRLFHRDHHYCQPVPLPPHTFVEFIVEQMVNEMVNQNLWDTYLLVEEIYAVQHRSVNMTSKVFV